MLPDWVFSDDDRRFMAEALAEATAAADRGEVPVGAVVTRGGEVVARAGNRRVENNDPAGHAEIIALRAAGRLVGDWRLSDCTLYVTLAFGSVIDLAGDPRIGPGLAHRGGLEAETSRQLLKGFFAKQRQSS
ncbi:MAG: nucleoside deaminase [Acidobacteriota bacterium]